MYTSYFANPETPINSISISAFPPKWYTGKEYKILSPSSELLMAYKNDDIDQKEYTRLFKKKLRKLDAKLIHKELTALHKSEVFSLLCYERPTAFCHRHIVSAWLNTELGLDIKEITKAPAHKLFPI